MEEQKQYGVVTAISMVIGIVIGSGIFFKSDDVLTGTGGDVALGILGFLLVGIGVIFGSLVILEYTSKNSEGGLITYANMAFSKNIAYYVSWFLISIYFPAFIVTFGYVTAIYLGQLLNISTNSFYIFATFFFILSAFISNIFSKKIGGVVQSISTIIKVIPLIIISICGIFLFDQQPVIFTPASTPNYTTDFLSVLIGIAFSFEGWIVVTNISSEMKDAKKNLPKALIVGLISVVTIYILYFYGITKIINPIDIIYLGDNHTTVAAEKIFGAFGGKVLISFIVVSVYGALNGMVLAYLRLPSLLVEKKMIKDLFSISNKKSKENFSKGNIIFCLIWVFAFYVFQMLIITGKIFANLNSPFDLSSMAMILTYIIYIGLYIKVFKVSNVKSKKLIFFSFVAVITSLIVLYGSLEVNGLLYLLISLFVCCLGYFVKNKEYYKNK